MDTITHDFLDRLIDFAPDGSGTSRSIADLQRDGTVAVYNMLARNRCAYIADEVGMGKTYVALGVMNILRYLEPRTRVIVITPRQNIQEKWVKELHNFVRNNWKIIGNRVKSLDSAPVWEPVVCDNLQQFAKEALIDQDRDFFLRMTSFSVAANKKTARERTASNLRETMRWLKRSELDVNSRRGFLDSYATALNSAVPEADLVIVDEAHNLKKGFGDNASNRNRVMGVTFGIPTDYAHGKAWFTQKAKRILLLSATPFEDDYDAIQKQMSIFSFDDVELTAPGSNDSLPISALIDRDPTKENLRRRVVERLLIRRTGGIKIRNTKYTRNMYRREWRYGGLRQFDKPISIEDPHTRLIIALMQKKVSEILQSEKFNNSFQIGMLSSFESFSQSLDSSIRQIEDENQGQGTFDDNDQQTKLRKEEKEGIDTNSILEIVRSYERTFGCQLPHPKQDRVAEALSDIFESGEKALVFVRRVATVSELGAKLNADFNSYLQKYMGTFLPEFKREIGQIFRRYQRELRDSRLNNANNPSTIEQEPETYHDSEDIELREDLGLTKDLGGVKSFFEWFFRGQGPKGLLSGAAFQRNRISSNSSVFSTLFDENFVADLLDVVPSMVLNALSERLGVSQEECGILLRNKAYRFLVEHSEHRDRPPRRLVFESYQAAALDLLADLKWHYRDRAAIILQERFSTSFSHKVLETPSGFPFPHEYLATQTIFTKLREYPQLMSQLWPLDKPNDLDFRGYFRRREQRRELFSAIARLGAASIDLYLLAIKQIGSFQLGTPSNDANIAVRVAHDFIERLDYLSNAPGFNAFYELSQAASTFDNLVAVNFPRINEQELSRLTVYFGNILGQQVPVAEMSGQVNKRPVAQFRMPGFPLVMISTDVLQEGEDLHTFCRRVIHYGIAWTPSAMEQRTGRVDRIGGLVQRKLDGSNTLPREEELIQVYYPHLQDTVELLQVRRVLKRLNKFMELIHEEFSDIPIQDSSLDTDRAVHDELQLTPQYKKQLKSAFDVKGHWLKGSKKAKDVRELDWDNSFEHFKELLNRFVDEFSVVSEPETTKHSFEGHLLFDDCFSAQITIPKFLKGKRHEFVVRLRSHVAGEETLLQCESPIVEIDIGNRRAFSDLKSLIDSAKRVKICLRERVTKDLDRVFIRDELLFNRFSTTYEDLLYLVGNVIPVAATFRTKWDKISDPKT